MNMFKDLDTRQKIVLAIYAIVSLPLLPLFAIMYPLATWVVGGKRSLVDFLSISMAVSIFIYMVVGLRWCTQ